MTDIFGPASALNAVAARPSDGRQYGAADTFFKDCSSASTQDGTQVSAAWLNQVTGVLRTLARANGLKQDGVTPVVPYDQSDNMPLNALLQVVQRGQANWAVDKGTADAMLATPAVAVAEYLPGMRFLVLKNPSVGANATSTPTINLGLGNLTVTKDDASAISPGDLKKGALFEVEIDGAGNARLTNLLTISDVLALIASLQIPGGRQFTLSGSGTWMPPAGLAVGAPVFVRMNGGGGGGGGAYTSGSTTSTGVGGGGGEYAEGIILLTAADIANGIPYAVAGAVPGGLGSSTPTNGTNGQTSSFGGRISAAGGIAGTAGLNSVSSGSGTGGTGGTGGSYRLPGGGGGFGPIYNSSACGGGAGGYSPYGGPSPSTNVNANGSVGLSPGGGGNGGAASSASQSANGSGGSNGGNGAPGTIRLQC